MRRVVIMIVAGAALLCPSGGKTATSTALASTNIILQLDAQPTAEQLSAITGQLDRTGSIRGIAGLPRTFVINALTPKRQAALIKDLARRPGVRHVQPDFSYQAQFVPNDPLVARQWAFQTVNAQAAWDLDTTAPLYGGDPSIKVAVLDSGFAPGPDFASIHTVLGYDYVNLDADPRDDNGHGTHVTGTIAQSTDNALAGAGLAYETTIIPIKVLGADGQGSTVAITQGITFAQAQGAQVINLSLGGGDDDPILHEAIIQARAAGITVVCAAGNEGATQLSFPAQYDEVVAVSAVRFDQTRTSYANIGAGLDLVAPGGDLSVDQNGDGDPDGIMQQTCTSGACTAWDNFLYVGTSQAAPHVSAAAALLLAAGADPTQIQAVLQATAKDLGATGYDTTYGYGLLDVGAAMLAVVQDSTPPTGTIVINGGAATTGTSEIFLTLAATDATGIASMQLSNDGVTFAAPEALIEQKIWNFADSTVGGTAAVGTHTVYVRFTDKKGNVSAAITDSIVFDQTPPTGVSIHGYTTKAKQRRFTDGLPTTLVRPYFQLSAADESGIEGFYVSWGTKASADPKTDGEYQVEHSFAPPKTATVGTYYLRVRAKDNVGNISAIETFTFRRRKGFFVLASTSSPALRLLPAEGGSLNGLSSLTGPVDGLSVATADLDGDGSLEFVVAPQTGKPQVTILSNRGKIIRRFLALPKGFRGGLRVAVGDLDADGTAEIVVVPAHGVAQVGVFTTTGKVVRRFFALPNKFHGGSVMAVADVDPSVGDEIVLGTASQQSTLLVLTGEGKLLTRVKPFGNKSDSGIDVAVSDLDADGTADLVVATHGESCQLKVLTPTGLLASNLTPKVRSFKTGCEVTTGDVDGNGQDEIFVSADTQARTVTALTKAGVLVRRIALPTTVAATTFLAR